MALAPAIVQSVSLQFNAASGNISLPQACQAGNSIYLIVFGTSYAATIPSNFTLVTYNEDGLNNEISLFTKVVEASETSAPPSYAVGTAQGTVMFVLQEIIGTPVCTVNHGACGAPDSVTLTTGSLLAYDASRSMRQIVFEWDNRGPTMSTPSGWAQEATFTDTGSSTYYAGTLWKAPTTLSGVQSVTSSGATNYPAWLDIVFALGSSVILTSGQKSSVLWWY